MIMNKKRFSQTIMNKKRFWQIKWVHTNENKCGKKIGAKFDEK